jgi:hypothetical protein
LVCSIQAMRHEPIQLPAASSNPGVTPVVDPPVISVFS